MENNYYIIMHMNDATRGSIEYFALSDKEHIVEFLKKKSNIKFENIIDEVYINDGTVAVSFTSYDDIDREYQYFISTMRDNDINNYILEVPYGNYEIDVHVLKDMMDNELHVFQHKPDIDRIINIIDGIE